MMAVKFLLFLILHAGPGDAVTLGGTREYVNLEACQTDAQRMMHWLTQPGVAVEWQCQRLERRVRSSESIG